MLEQIGQLVNACRLCTTGEPIVPPQLVLKNSAAAEEHDVLFVVAKPPDSEAKLFAACKEIASSDHFSITFAQRCYDVDDSLAGQRCSIYSRILFRAYRYFIIDRASSEILRLPYAENKIKTTAFGIVLFVENVLESSKKRDYATSFQQLVQIPNRKMLIKIS